LRTPLNTAVIAFVLAGLVLCLLTPFALLRTKTALLLTVSLLFPGFVFLGSLVHIPLRTVGLCVFLGDVSYPLYLLHHLLIDTFDVPAVLARAQLHPLLAVAAVAIGSLVLAQIVLVFYDVPVRRILTQSYKRRTTPRLVIS
jgi:peptidoglycan/LPS O-acetylase OafA/YrhL